MIDFDRWFRSAAAPAPAPAPEPPSIDEQLEGMGLDLMKDGSVLGKCRVCGNQICWTDYLTVEEILRDGVGEELCGGSERCCP